MKKTAFFLIGIFISISSIASEWVYVTGWDKMLLNVDVSTIVVFKNGDRKAWAEYLYSESQTENGTKYSRALDLSVYRCSDRTVATWQQILYDSIEGGNVVQSMQVSKEKAIFTEVAPQSIGEKTLNFVCKYRTGKK